MNVRELLDQAAPRPWLECRANGGKCQCGNVWSLPADALITSGLSANAREHYGVWDDETTSASARLIAVAVNEYEALRELEAATHVYVYQGGSRDRTDAAYRKLEEIREAADAARSR